MLEYVNGGARQGRYAGMGEEDALPRDGKEAVAKRFIVQDMVDAKVDLILILFHGSIFAQIGEKANPM